MWLSAWGQKPDTVCAFPGTWLERQQVPEDKDMKTGKQEDHPIVQLVFALLLLLTHTLAQGPDPNQGYDSQNIGPLVYIDRPLPLGGFEAILKEFIYPEEALASRIEGTVTLTCIIDRDGHAQEVRAILGPPQLMSAAEDAVELSQWNPGRLNRTPQPLRVQFDLDIRISKSLELKETTLKDYSNNLILGPLFFGLIYLILSAV